MSDFVMELPNDIIKDFENLYKDSEKIFGEMTKAGAEAVEKNVIANLPPELKNSNFRKCVDITKTYKTPSDDGINTKVIISGYYDSKSHGRMIPAPMIANFYEYGTSNRYTASGAYRGVMTKKPFFRKSFKKAQIEKVMLDKQKELSGGLLDE